jgi:ribosomal protein uL22
MVYHYATQDFDPQTMVRLVKRFAKVSKKQSIEIGTWIKGKPLAKAVEQLQGVLSYTTAVPFKKFNRHYGHRPGGIGPGRYPQKTAELFLELLAQAKANASQKSLDELSLVIHNVVVQQGPKQFHYGRIRGIKQKNTHIELIVAQKAIKAKPARKQQKQQKSAEVSAEKTTVSAKPAPAKAVKQPVVAHAEAVK